MKVVNEIKLYNADTFEYSGSIMIFNDSDWEFRDMENHFLVEITKGMPLKGVLSVLISFNIVYDIIPSTWKCLRVKGPNNGW